ncbi:MAG: hypothetical protein Q4F29_03920, partial [Lachnospiraceae bacterium]|nr:hypothetical protein [Lachnospiraceae bacterium]
MNRLIKYLAILGVILTAAGFCLAAGAKAYGAGNGSIRFWKDWGQETVFPWEHSAGGDEWRHDFRHHDSWWQEFSRDSFWRDLEEDWEAEDRDAEGRGSEDWN